MLETNVIYGDMILTIAIPTYNRPQELSLTVRAVAKQISDYGLMDEVELLICDNSDKSNIDVITGVNLLYVNYTWNEINIGQARNINKLVQVSKGEYVWILADDDSISSNAVNVVIDELKKIASSQLDVRFLTFYTGDSKSSNIWIKEDTLKKRMHGLSFLQENWEHPIFISNNVVNRASALKLIESYNLGENYNDTYQNSVISIGVILDGGSVAVIPKTIVYDSWRDKFYELSQGARVKITDMMKLEYFFLTINRQYPFKKAFRIEIKSKFIFWLMVYSYLSFSPHTKMRIGPYFKVDKIRFVYKLLLHLSRLLQIPPFWFICFYLLSITNRQIANSIKLEISGYLEKVKTDPVFQTYDPAAF